jgi:hypothetical protein
MTYYGIKAPKNSTYNGSDPYIWWIANSPDGCWRSFLTFPSERGDRNAHRLPISEAIEAYQAIGYKCVRLKVEEDPE